MSELILHFGMPKTGSTAIQRFLFDNQKILLSQGILYPVSGRYSEISINHRSLSYTLNPSPKKIHNPIPKPNYSFDEYCDQLHKEIFQTNAKKVVLSSEMFFNPVFDAECLTYLKSRLNFYIIRILIILRRQEDHIESSYSQKITGPAGFSGTPSQYLEHMLESNIYDYYDRLMTIEQVFGKENLYIFWYHDIKDDAARVIKDLCQIDETNFVKSSNRVNVRKGWLYVRILQFINKYTAKGGKYRFICRRLAYLIDKTVSAVSLGNFVDRLCKPYTEAQKMNIRSEFSSINRLVNERYMIKKYR